MYSRSISVKGCIVNEGIEVGFTNVYGPNDEGERDALWEELDVIHTWCPALWCVCWDFNVVRFPSERRKGAAFTSGMESFSDFIDRNE